LRSKRRAAPADGLDATARRWSCFGSMKSTSNQLPCTVIAASDPFLNPVSEVSCFVVVE
jgi:hypothetical protein